jgi:hypothetical protein
MALGAAYVAEQQRVAAAAPIAAVPAVAAAAAIDPAADIAEAPAAPEAPSPPASVAAEPATSTEGVRSRRMLPVGLALVAAVAVAAVAIASNMLGGGTGSTPSASPATSLAVVPSASPSLLVTPSPSPIVTPSPTPTPIPTPTPTPGGLQARISSIAVSNGRYVVDYEAFNYTPQLPNGRHVHFFFDTVKPEDAGVPGRGPWELYAGPVPFTVYRVSDRPSGATQMCILSARPDHSVLPNSGNCVDLPT